MAKSRNKPLVGQPMRVQARHGSPVEKRYFAKSALPGGPVPSPADLAGGLTPSPSDDLIFHGGKIVAQMGFQNVYVGSSADWLEDDVTAIDAAITRAMQEQRLNNVMQQYFAGQALDCDARPSFFVGGAKPKQLDEAAVQATVLALFDEDRIVKSDLDRTIFNLVLPAGTVLKLDDSSSLEGLGGYHGSLHAQRGGKRITLYYSADVFSQRLPGGRENGIDVFDRPWKNVVGTLYHELNEFRTDADVNDAITSGDNGFLGWTSGRGHEVGDQPIGAANGSLGLVFKQILAANKKTPVQFMYSNAVHGAEGPIAAPHA